MQKLQKRTIFDGKNIEFGFYFCVLLPLTKIFLCPRVCLYTFFWDRIKKCNSVPFRQKKANMVELFRKMFYKSLRIIKIKSKKKLFENTAKSVSFIKKISRQSLLIPFAICKRLNVLSAVKVNTCLTCKSIFRSKSNIKRYRQWYCV